MNKRVHEIAKERGLATKDVIERLKAAGVNVKSASSSVDEDAAVRVLGNGGAPRAASSRQSATGGRDGASREKSARQAAPRKAAGETARAAGSKSAAPRATASERTPSERSAPSAAASEHAPARASGEDSPRAAGGGGQTVSSEGQTAGADERPGRERGWSAAFGRRWRERPQATHPRLFAGRACAWRGRRQTPGRDRFTSFAPRTRRRRSTAIEPAPSAPAPRATAPRRLRRRGRIPSLVPYRGRRAGRDSGQLGVDGQGRRRVSRCLLCGDHQAADGAGGDEDAHPDALRRGNRRARREAREDSRHRPHRG